MVRNEWWHWQRRFQLGVVSVECNEPSTEDQLAALTAEGRLRWTGNTGQAVTDNDDDDDDDGMTTTTTTSGFVLWQKQRQQLRDDTCIMHPLHFVFMHFLQYAWTTSSHMDALDNTWNYCYRLFLLVKHTNKQTNKIKSGLNASECGGFWGFVPTYSWWYLPVERETSWIN